MQIVKDRKIILDLDDTIEANCICARGVTAFTQGSHGQFFQEERLDVTPMLRIELFTYVKPKCTAEVQSMG